MVARPKRTSFLGRGDLRQGLKKGGACDANEFFTELRQIYTKCAPEID